MTTDMVEALRARLLEIKQERGVGWRALEYELGLPSRALRGLVDEGDEFREPRAGKVQQIANAIGFEVYVGPPRPQKDAPEHRAQLEADMNASVVIRPIPGPGSNNLDPIALPRRWFEMAGVSENAVGLVRMTDEGMVPSMPRDGIAVLSTGPIPPRSSRPVCFDHKGRRLIRRTQWAADDILILMADNPDFPPITFTGDAARDFQPLGEVVWLGTDFGQRRQK
ncbi:MAG: S24 family peptidase [Shimia sp.]